MFTRHFEFGPALFEHLLLFKGLSGAAKVGKDFDAEKDGDQVLEVFKEAEGFVKETEAR